MTPERIVSLIVSLVPVLSIISGVIIALATSRHRSQAGDKDDPAPAIGVTVDDDHADDAIEAWRDRALAAEAERNELRHMLEGAMRRLPEQQRVAVILSYHENMSNGEIAEVLDTTVAAVESLLKRGRQQLRELLRRHERDIRHAFTEL